MHNDKIMYLSLQVTKQPRVYLLHPQLPLSTTINAHTYASVIRSHTVYKLQHIVSFGDPALIISQNGIRLLCKLGLPDKMRAAAVLYMPFAIKQYRIRLSTK